MGLSIILDITGKKIAEVLLFVCLFVGFFLLYILQFCFVTSQSQVHLTKTTLNALRFGREEGRK